MRYKPSAPQWTPNNLWDSPVTLELKTVDIHSNVQVKTLGKLN